MINKEKTKSKKIVETIHKPVLLKEVIEQLDLQKNDVVLDSTVGGGGYLRAICEKLGDIGKIIGLDQDSEALEKIKNNSFFKEKENLYLFNENFRNLEIATEKVKIQKINKAVFDLGISSDQLESAGRGFSFLKNEALLMTLKKDINEEDLTAKEIVNNWDEENIADIIFNYGEERYARRIAKEICLARQEKEIETTFDLVEIIKKAVPNAYKFKKIHCATKTFQALRITVNDEIEGLKIALEKVFQILEKEGRVAVVSFHSLEDRIVKRFFKKLKEEGQAVLINKKPIIADKEELFENPRARSAKLRVIKKII